MKSANRKSATGRRRFDTDAALDEAMRLFWKHGYEATSMAMLLNAMGLTAPSLYAAFGNKEALFRKAVGRYTEIHGAKIYAALQDPGLPVAPAFAAVFEASIALLSSSGTPPGCLVTFGAANFGEDSEALADFLRSIRKSRETALKNRLVRAVKEGELPADTDTARLARFFHAVLLGMRHQSLDGATGAQLRAVAEDALKLLKS